MESDHARPRRTAPGPRRRARRGRARGAHGAATSSAACCGSSSCCSLVSLLTFIIFYTLPSADPAQLRAGRQPNPELVEQIRAQPRARQPVVPAVLRLHEGPGAALRLRLQLPEQRSGQGADLRPAAGIDLGRHRRRRDLAPDRDRGRDHLGGQEPDRARPRRPWASRWSRSRRRSTGSGSSRSTSSRPTSASSTVFMGAGSYVPFSQDPWIWFQSLILPWFVLAAAFAALYARLLRGNLIEVMSEDYIRTARAKGLPERRVVYAPRPAQRDHADRHGRRASTSASCSGARSWSRPSSTSPASAGSPSTRSRTPTCR